MSFPNPNCVWVYADKYSNAADVMGASNHRFCCISNQTCFSQSGGGSSQWADVGTGARSPAAH